MSNPNNRAPSGLAPLSSINAGGIARVIPPAPPGVITQALRMTASASRIVAGINHAAKPTER